MTLVKYLCLTMTLLTGISQVKALEAPTADEVDRVINYLNGADQTLLLGYQICQSLQAMPGKTYKCIGEYSTDAVPQNSNPYILLNFLVPRQGESEVQMRFSFETRPYPHSVIQTNKGMRYRTARRLETRHLGRWQLELTQSTAHGYKTLSKFQYQVVPASQMSSSGY